MNRPESLQALETFSKGAFVLVLLITACGTALVVLSTGTPPHPGSFRIDYDFETTVMRLILNIGLPVAVLAGAALTWAAIRSRTYEVFAGALVIVSFIGIFACALAAWSSLVAIHGKGANLWSLIWWSITS